MDAASCRGGRRRRGRHLRLPRPGLEIFSRYSRVEKANGEAVSLKEYLVQVWAAVSNEALSLIFKDADAAGLEPDARLTAMWLWTLSTGGTDPAATRPRTRNADEEPDAEDEESNGRPSKGRRVRPGVRRGPQDRPGARRQPRRPDRASSR